MPKSGPSDRSVTPAFAIATCCSADWLPYAAATLLSCWQNGAKGFADLYVAVIDANAGQIQRFESFCAMQGLDAKLINIAPSEIPKGIAFHRFSSAALLRLKLDCILPATYRRVLYLDSDILAESAINEVFDFDLQGLPLGAVEDYQSLPGPLRMFHSHPEKIGLGHAAAYFNSGVLLFDWQQVCRGHHLARCIERISEAAKAGVNFKLPDQDVLNIEFADNWARMPLRHNLMAFFVDYFPAKPVFRHYSNRLKPWGPTWQPGFAKARAYYRRVFESSPWPGFAPGRYTGFSVTETLGSVMRRLDPISGRRYARHFNRPQPAPAGERPVLQPTRS